MEFTCPHCHKKFETKLREASRSEKANAARKRNGALGGHPKASEVELVRIFLKKDEWTWQDYAAAVKKNTGAVYSRVRVFALLKKFRTLRPVVVVLAGGKTVVEYDYPLREGESREIQEIYMDKGVVHRNITTSASRVGRTMPQDTRAADEMKTAKKQHH